MSPVDASRHRTVVRLQLRRVEVELVEVVTGVVAECDDGLAPDASCELQDGIVSHCVADARLALVRHDALAVVVEALDAHLVVERSDELAIGVVHPLARLPGVFDPARGVAEGKLRFSTRSDYNHTMMVN